MNTLSLLACGAIFLVFAFSCYLAEKQSRKWYEDRMLLRAQGFFVALGAVSLLWAVVK